MEQIAFEDDTAMIYKQKGKSNISIEGNINVSLKTEKSLLVISNKFGIVIFATQKGFCVVMTNNMEKAHKNVITASPVQHLSLSPNEEQLLVVLSEYASHYYLTDIINDVDRKTLKIGIHADYAEWRNNRELLCLRRETKYVYILDALESKKILHSFKDETVHVSRHPDGLDKFICIQKGGQVFVNDIEKPDKIEIEIPAWPEDNYQKMVATYIRWIHKDCFLTGYVGQLTSDEPILGLILSTREDENSEFVHCFGDLAVDEEIQEVEDLIDNPTAAYFHTIYLAEWNLILVTSNYSGSMKQLRHINGNWVDLDLAEGCRVVLGGGDKCLGTALDLTSTSPLPNPHNQSEKCYPPSPILLYLTADGKLNPHDFYNSEVKDLTNIPFMTSKVAQLPPPQKEITKPDHLPLSPSSTPVPIQNATSPGLSVSLPSQSGGTKSTIPHTNSLPTVVMGNKAPLFDQKPFVPVTSDFKIPDKPSYPSSNSFFLVVAVQLVI